MSCQLKSINDIKQKNSLLNNVLQIRVKLLRLAKKKFIFAKNKLVHFLKNSKKETIGISDQDLINPGDMVRVRLKEEIRRMLNDYEKYKGCLFIDEMYEHCNKTYKVLKVIEYFFDEAKQKLCKCNDIVILEGVTCSGRQRLYSVSCDRNCFFYWHRAWLKKI
jgi:hypothetical protein